MNMFVAEAIKNLNLNGLPHAEANGNAVQTVLSIVIGVVGALCLLFITIGGFRYILSEGDPQAISKAKSTVVYALVGLVVVIMAEAIVAFVFGRLTS
jgi:hypothetical protein